MSTVEQEQLLYHEFLDRVGDEKLMMAKYREAVATLRRLNEGKTEDYNSNGVTFSDCWPEGCRDLYLGLHNKVLRLRSLVGREGPLKEPNHESREDNALDLAAYSLWFCVLNKLAREMTKPQGDLYVTAEGCHFILHDKRGRHTSGLNFAEATRYCDKGIEWEQVSSHRWEPKPKKRREPTPHEKWKERQGKICTCGQEDDRLGRPSRTCPKHGD